METQTVRGILRYKLMMVQIMPVAHLVALQLEEKMESWEKLP
jgi:hypothetical protein